MTDQVNTVTQASDWLKSYEEGVIVELPSLHTIRMRPVALDVLLSSGKIPDLLTPLASKTLWDVMPLDKAQTDFKLAGDLTKLMDIVVPAAVLEPKIYLGTGELPKGHIRLEHLSIFDKVCIFQVAIQPVSVLDSFRGKQIGNLESLLTEQDDELSSESDT